MNRRWAHIIAGAALLSGTVPSGLAQTEGTAVFTVRTVTHNGNYAPDHVLAIWVTNESGQFVQTLKRRAASREQYLYQWISDSNRNDVDGTTGATLGSHQTHVLPWDCTDSAGAVVPDGTYRIHVEMTERNGQGPWTADTLQFVKGPAPASATFPDQTNFRDLSLTYTPSVATQTLVARGSTWRYHDRGIDLHGTGWTTLGYDDTDWEANQTRLGYGGDGESSPPLSFGPDPDNKYPCYYFRHEFPADAVPDILLLRVARDDGVIVYLNGAEVARDNMDHIDPPAYGQYATGTAGNDDETRLIEFTPPPSQLAVGRNILAAEIHQAQARSSDIGFELELKAGDPTLVPHDVALLGTLPALVLPDDTTTIQVVVTNRTTTLESVEVTLRDLTRDMILVGPVPVLVPGLASTPIELDWDLTGVPPGDYDLRVDVDPIPGETAVSDNVLEALVAVRDPAHDIAVTGVIPSGEGTQGDTIQLDVTLANLGTYTETFLVTLRDTTTGADLGSTTVSDLAALASTTVSLSWSTLGVSVGPHALAVVVSGVDGDADPDNDSAGTVGWIRESGFGLKAVGALAGLGGHGRCLARDGDLLAVGFGAELLLVDVTAPDTASSLGRIRLPGRIEAVALAEGLACTANGNRGVQLIDVGDPTTPVHVQTFDTSGFAADVALSGSLLAVADGRTGIRLIDVTTPANPTLVGALVTGGPVRAVTFDGSRLIALDRDQGVFVVDVGDPTVPTVVGRSPVPAFGADVVVQGTLAYIVDQSGYLSVVDLDDPAAPVSVGRVRLSSMGRAIATDGTLLAVAVGESGIDLVDGSVPNAPVRLATYDTTGEATGIHLASAQAWIVDGFEGLLGLDLSTPGTPVPNARLSVGGRAADVVVQGEYAYVARGQQGLQVVHLPSPGIPVPVATNRDAIQAQAVAVEGSLLCIADGDQGMVVLGIDDPSAPVYRSTYTHPDLGFARRVALRGDRAAVTDGRHVQHIDLSNPDAPAWLATYTCPGYAYDLAALDRSTLVAAGSAGLVVLDAMAPTGTALAQRPTPGPARAVALSGGVAFVALQQAGWQRFDLSDPANPVVLDATPHAGRVTAISASGPLVAAADDTHTAATHHLAPPLRPVTLQTYQHLQHAMRLTARGPYLYVAEDDAGLAILDGSPGDHDLDRLPDDWEQHIVDADPLDGIDRIELVLPNDDFDGDRLSNLAEAIAGTDATDPDSVFAQLPMTRAAGAGPMEIRWLSQPDRTYTVYKSTNLVNGFTLLAGNLPATSPINTYRDPTPDSPVSFYLITIDDGSESPP